MSPSSRVRVDAAQTLRRSIGAGADALDVIRAAAETLLRVAPARYWSAVLLDPSTMLDTGGVHEHGFPEQVTIHRYEIEHTDEDHTDTVRSLARRPRPVSALSRSTAGRPDTSRYYREILAPLGLTDELRLLLRDTTHVWGLLVLSRTGEFTDREITFAETLSAPAAALLRRTMLSETGAGATLTHGPGMVMLDEDDRLLAHSPNGERLLGELPESHATVAGRMPYLVRALIARARAADRGLSQATVRTRSGRWLSLTAWRLDTSDGARTVVSINPAQPDALAAIILGGYSLSTREQQVTHQVLLGCSTSEIAEQLGISMHTVQDHLKAVFRKTGLSSRRELVADLLFRHYLPATRTRVPSQP